MSKNKFNGCYVKLVDDPTYWAVDDGERRSVANSEEMHAIGLRQVVPVSAKELKEIPLATEGKDYAKSAPKVTPKKKT
jgi:hypothetical protein